jgi:hypothetical protein
MRSGFTLSSGYENEHFDYIKGGKFIDLVSEYQSTRNAPSYGLNYYSYYNVCLVLDAVLCDLLIDI